MGKFKMLESLGIKVVPITAPLKESDFPIVSAREVERLFKDAKIGYGFGSPGAGSFTYSDQQDLSSVSFAQKCLILNIEDTNVETAESLAENVKKMIELSEDKGWPVKLEDFVDAVRKLTKKVLRE